MQLLYQSLSLFILCSLLSSCSGLGNIIEVASGDSDLSTLVTAVKAGGLVSTLEGTGPFTVFAPTNEAFAQLPAKILKFLLDPANKATLVDVLTYHVVGGAAVLSSELKDRQVITTVEKGNVTVFFDFKKIFINQAQVTVPDVKASNGVVHVVNKVLIPPKTAATILSQVNYSPEEDNIVQLAQRVPDLSVLVKALVAGGLVSTLEGTGPFTVFAPTNEAFNALPEGVLSMLLKPENKDLLVKVLTYHVAAGAAVKSTELSNGESITTVEKDPVFAYVTYSGIFINYAQVTKPDNEASNGIVHVVDQVLIPPGLKAELVKLVDLQAVALPNIVELAQSVPTLSTLVKALSAGGLVSTLEGTGPFTVFAPTNAAFAALPDSVLKFLLDPANKAALVDVLTFHVVSGAAVKSTDLKDREQLTTVEGKDLTAYVIYDQVFIDYAQVTQANVEASNGVVHVVDQVLVPPKTQEKLIHLQLL